MKRLPLKLFALLAIPELFLCLSLSAQEYHDAEAFGLKGHVRECKVSVEPEGSYKSNPYCFRELYFAKDGSFVGVTADYLHAGSDLIKEIQRSGDGDLERLFFSVKDFELDYHFYYHCGELYGVMVCEDEHDSLLSIFYDPTVECKVDIWTPWSSSELIRNRITYSDWTPEITAIVDEEFSKGNNILTEIQDRASKDSFKSLDHLHYDIKETDSHGNSTLLVCKEDGRTYKREITYWDDALVTPREKKGPSFKLSTSKKLTLSDMLSKPLGIIENPSKSIWAVNPDDVIMFIKNNPEWKCPGDLGSYEIKEGYNRTFKGYPVTVKLFDFYDSDVDARYSYTYIVSLGFDDEKSQADALSKMDQLFDTVLKEFGERGMVFTLSEDSYKKSADAASGGTQYTVSRTTPLMMGDKYLTKYYSVCISVDQPRR